jgi:hypothetical protein
MLLLLPVLALGIGACAPRQSAPAAAASAAYEYDLVIEVDNRSPQAVVIRYYRDGGGPHTLGMVPAWSSRRLVPPVAEIGHVFAETEAGQRLSRRAGSSVRIRRVRVDPAR